MHKSKASLFLVFSFTLLSFFHSFAEELSGMKDNSPIGSDIKTIDMQNTFIGHCHNIEISPFAYESCVNRSFQQIEMKINLTLSSCYGVERYPAIYENCINEVFDKIESSINGIYLSYCSGVERSAFSFENCVNRNFSEISRAN